MFKELSLVYLDLPDIKMDTRIQWLKERITEEIKYFYFNYTEIKHPYMLLSYVRYEIKLYIYKPKSWIISVSKFHYPKESALVQQIKKQQ